MRMPLFLTNAFTFCFCIVMTGEIKKKYAKANKLFPTMEDLLKLHQEEDHYLMFAKEFVRIVVGKSKWTHQCFRYNLSEYCSASGEAFCLLVLENNYMRWCGMIEAGDYGDKGHTAPPPLYTNAGKSNRNNGTAKPFQGWTVEGYERFDALHKLVRVDRAKKSRHEFEERLKEVLLQENSKKRKAKMDDEDDGEEVVYPAHDFDDVDRGGIRSSSTSNEDVAEGGGSPAAVEEAQSASDDEEESKGTEYYQDDDQQSEHSEDDF